MGREVQKKKKRSSIPRVKHKSRRLKNGNRKINILGNAIIAQNWDRNLTLTQNYRRLGLTSQLNTPTGGSEKSRSPMLIRSISHPRDDIDSLHVLPTAKVGMKLKPAEARVERDPETGKILRVVHSDDDEMEIAGRKRRRTNPLEDPLSELEGAGIGAAIPATASSEVVRALEEQVAMEESSLKRRRPRQQSKREEEWIEKLVERYGDDVRAMSRDKRLNPMQQTEGDLKRRLRKWKERRN